MSNPKPNPKRAKKGPEIVQRVRVAILNAFDAVEKDGRLISEILADKFKDDPLRFMDMASKYCPKDVDLYVERATDVQSLTEQELDERIAVAIAARREESEATGAPIASELH